jgi:hypothetical protein
MSFDTKVVEPKLWESVLEYAREHGAYEASKRYAEETKFNQNYLYRKLVRLVGTGRTDIGEETEVDVSGGEKGTGRNRRMSPEEILANAKAKAQSRKYAYEGIELTKKEKKLIRDIADGTVDMETASRVIAAKAFEKLLKYPDSASFTSFIQSELLKLKRQELTDKNTWAMELVNRMFAGELPPRICPKCGEVLVKLPELVGEVVEDAESLPVTRNDPE